MMDTARGTFDVTMQPGPAELGGAITRFELDKTFHGDLQGAGSGVMLTGGDPQAGAAGYVAIETVHGSLAHRQGSFALQQFGLLRDGSQTLHYEVVPGSGTGGWLESRASCSSASTRMAPTNTSSRTRCRSAVLRSEAARRRPARLATATGRTAVVPRLRGSGRGRAAARWPPPRGRHRGPQPRTRTSRTCKPCSIGADPATKRCARWTPTTPAPSTAQVRCFQRLANRSILR